VQSASSTGGSAGGASGASGSAGAVTAGGSGGSEDPDPDPMITPEERAALLALSPDELPPPPPDASNALADDPAAAKLGQRLFFTPLFAGPLLDSDNDGGPRTLGKKGDTQKVACAGCHVPSTDFMDTRSPSEQISLASGWVLRRAPSLLDVGQAKLLTWDGRRDTMYNQVFGPIEAPLEMNSSRLFAAEQIFVHFRSEYETVFGPMPPLDDAARFPPLSPEVTGCTPAGSSPPSKCDGKSHGVPGDGAEYDSMSAADQDAVTRVVVNAGKAIGAYERLLRCGPSRFDAFMRGDASAMSRAEQRGAALFVGEGKCDTCHSGPYLSDQKFHNVGLAPGTVAAAFVDADDHGASAGLAAALADPLNVKGAYSDGDDGRLPDEVLPSMEGAFRTPALRCVGRRPSLMHTGQMLTLLKVVAFFDAGGDKGAFFGESEIGPLGLSARERQDLAAFLMALNGPGAAPDLVTPP